MKHSASKYFSRFLVVASFLLAPAFLPEPVRAADEAEKYFMEANQFSAKGQFAEAIKAYKKSITANANNANVHYNLGNVYVAVDKIDEAVKEYLAAIKIYPLSPEYHRNLGFAYALQKKGDMAKRKYEDLKKMSPAHADELMLWIQKAKQGEK